MKPSRHIPRLGMNRVELSQSIGVSVVTIDNMVAEGFLPPPKQWHSRKIWVVSEVEKAMLNWPTKDGESHIPFVWEEETLSPLEKWKKDRDRAEASSPDDRTARSRLDNPDYIVAEHYRKLGFDPKTMGSEEYTALYKKAEDKWRASLPSKPIGKREKHALEVLSLHGVGVFVACIEIKGCGSDTEERLIARKFIETRNHPTFTNQISHYALTEAGMAAWKKIERER